MMLSLNLRGQILITIRPRISPERCTTSVRPTQHFRIPDLEDRLSTTRRVRFEARFGFCAMYQGNAL